MTQRSACGCRRLQQPPLPYGFGAGHSYGGGRYDFRAFRFLDVYKRQAVYQPPGGEPDPCAVYYGREAVYPNADERGGSAGAFPVVCGACASVCAAGLLTVGAQNAGHSLCPVSYTHLPRRNCWRIWLRWNSLPLARRT